jgi:trans-aconitate 2-methyltransferase
VPSWHPAQYLRFGEHRTRPARDLLAAVGVDDPGTVVDVGCGPGNSTALLSERWPLAEVVGLDSSGAMIERARQALPDIRFVEADLREWRPREPVDVVFSNATLQWLEDHPSVFSHLLGWLIPGGALAVQMPANFDQPSHVLMRELAASPRWNEQVGGVLRESPVAAPEEYWRMLAPHGTVGIWTTEYLQVLEGEDPVTEWVQGTGLRPVLDRLEEPEAAAFVAEYSELAGRAYPRRADGMTLFPFRRLFIVVRTHGARPDGR